MTLDHTILYNQLRTAVFNNCPSWLSGDEDDITQTAIQRLVRVSESRGIDNVGTAAYVRKAARMAIIDRIKSIQARRKFEEPTDFLFTDCAHEFTPERLLLSKEIASEISRAIGTVKLTHRSALVLRLKGCTMSEIATELGISRKDAENRSLRGMVRLREILVGRGMITH